jgi:hypothetical protein
MLLTRASQAAAIVSIVALIGCKGRQGSPTAPSNPQASPPRATALRIEGPPSVAPGAIVQYKAVATFTDGTTADVTASANWGMSPSNTHVASVVNRGMLRGDARGEADIIASYAPLIARLRVFVLEDGTFRLSGRVLLAEAPVWAARVSVVAGIGAGLSTTSQGDGSYALYGVSGDVRIEVSLDGFVTESRGMTVNDHMTSDWTLHPAEAEYAGTWQFTVHASPSCGPELPAEARTRTYVATLAQAGSNVSIYLTSGVFDEPVSLKGELTAQGLTLDLWVDKHTYLLPYYALVEVVEPGRFLGLAGTARGGPAGSGLAGTLDGEFSLYRGTAFYWANDTRLESSCQRTDHTFQLERR